MKNGKMSLIDPKIFNFPNQPQSQDYGKLTFPSDLVSGSIPNGRNFYTSLQFVSYNVAQQVNTFGSNASTVSSYSIPSGSPIKLPIPLKLNDNLVLNWSPISLTDTLAKFADQFTGSAASSALQLANIAGIGSGTAVNPLMFLQFQRPDYRQFSLSWVLAPKNAKESDTIAKIIKKCKQAASPSKYMGNGLLMGYPEVALIKIMPKDVFGNLIFKPCVITSVQVNYNGAAAPSFFKNGAPTIVALTLNVMEMQFWFRDEIK